MTIHDYTKDDLVAIDNMLAKSAKTVTITGQSLSINEIISVARASATTALTNDKKILNRILTCYTHMMEDVKNGVPIYGCNTGYGARAEKVVNKGTSSERLAQARLIAESIVHTDVTVGPLLSPDIVRSAMLIRTNMLTQGISAVRKETLDLLIQLLNKHLTPVVNAYGGLGASGDLAHNGRIISVMRQLPGTRVWNKNNGIVDAPKTLKAQKINPLKLEPKEGLGLANGDNFSTAAAALIVTDLVHLTLIADVTSAMMVEVLKGTNRTFHPFLAKLRPHPGVGELAGLYRYLLNGSKLAYQELDGQKPRAPGVNIQDVYSLRCVTQAEGFNREQLKWALTTIERNANSVSDNPLWVAPEYTTEGEKPWQWVSGGNFFALHMGEIIDSMRKIITRLIKRNDRQLHRLLTPHANNSLPANLSDDAAISSCAFKGIQLQSGMFDVYSMLLAQPVTTMFGVHEESNQDITPHSLTSAIFAWENMRLLRYSLAMNLLAIAQAVDLRGGPKLLSPKTVPVYECIRKHSKYITKERPLGPDIETIATTIDNGELMKIIRTIVLAQYGRS